MGNYAFTMHGRTPFSPVSNPPATPSGGSCDRNGSLVGRPNQPAYRVFARNDCPPAPPSARPRLGSKTGWSLRPGQGSLPDLTSVTCVRVAPLHNHAKGAQHVPASYPSDTRLPPKFQFKPNQQAHQYNGHASRSCTAFGICGIWTVLEACMNMYGPLYCRPLAACADIPIR